MNETELSHAMFNYIMTFETKANIKIVEVNGMKAPEYRFAAGP
jgi:hypothetical protein